MIKPLLISFALLGASNSFSQTFTQANEPMIGESKLMYVCDSFAVDFEAFTGNGATWNYSGLPAYPGATKLIEVLTPSATPYSADYPNATATLKIQDISQTYFATTANQRLSKGYVLENTGLGTVKATFQTDDYIMMNYPMTMNTTILDVFGGNLSFTYNSIPQNPTMDGASKTMYDGIGTFIQPDGTTLLNISRFRLIDTAEATVPFAGTVQIIRSQYEYYDLNGTDHLPVFIHMSAKVLSGFPSPLIDETVVLSQVQGPQTANLKELNANSLKLYPNPAKDVFHIANIDTQATVQLVDLSGRVLSLAHNGDGQFDVSGVRSGLYLVKVISGSGVQSQTLIIE